MRLAVEEAARGMEQGEGGPFGALIVKDGIPIASAHNEVLAANDPTAHAEMLAIRRASQALGTFDLSGCVLYTSCYPCPMCLGAILWARIRTVYYGASTEDAARAGFDDARFYDALANPASALDLRPVDSPEAARLFLRWSDKPDRTAY
ncbi:MAG: nucleoside deaminase [Campylobacterota bacterium]